MSNKLLHYMPTDKCVNLFAYVIVFNLQNVWATFSDGRKTVAEKAQNLLNSDNRNEWK